MNEGVKDINRRKFLRQSASFMAVGAAAFVLPAANAEEAKLLDDPMRVPGVLPRPYGERSPFEKQTRLGGAGPGAPHGWGANAPDNFNSLTPLQDLYGIVTPSSLHFERHHNGVPAIDPARHRLLIHGLVELMDAKSVITYPSGQQHIQPGIQEIRGLAWSGRGRVTKVEVSMDGGRMWQAARLQEPVLSKCHTRFRFPWRWNGQEAILQSRCVDETGYVQPSRQDLVKVRGTSSTYHYNAIQSWRVERDGRVRNIYA